MKKTRYYISFDNLEIDMSTAIEISKKEYDAQLNFLREQVRVTARNGSEVTLNELDPVSHDFGNCVQTLIWFTCGCAGTLLQKVECKKGYCFTPKK